MPRVLFSAKARPTRRAFTRAMTAGLVIAAMAAPAAYGAVQRVSPVLPVGSAGVVPYGAQRIGSLPGRTTVRIDVVLRPGDPAALAQYAVAVATPGSPLYHAYIGRSQFASMFGPARTTVAGVYSALRARGLQPGQISSDHLSIPVRATAARIESALGIGMARYRLENGRSGFANTRAPRLPATVAAHVQAIIGLDNLARPQPLSAAPRRPSASARAAGAHGAGAHGVGPHTAGAVPQSGEPTGGPQPCSSATALQADGAKTADQLAWSYQFSPLYKAGDLGSGVTVGIVEFGEPDLPADIAAYQACYDINTKVSYDKVDGFSETGPGQGEAALDIETVAGLAPKANIVVYQAPNTGKAEYDVYRTIVEQDKARVISESYGLCEYYEGSSAALALNTLLEQASVQGQSVVASSGDTGSEGCYVNNGNPRQLSVNFPASDPQVLGVGGTTLLTVAQHPSEAVWNDRETVDGAGGGGESTIFGRPAFQGSYGVKSKVREVPDVSADADPHSGYVIYHSGAWTYVGGTSAAAPLWAALLALTDAKCPASPVGWVNPAIYKLASKTAKVKVINDIGKVSGSLNDNDYTGEEGGKYPVGTGYDMATGLGSPIGGNLANQLCKPAAKARGYWLATASGKVYAFGAPARGSVSHPSSPVIGIAADHQTGGYWLVTAKGHVYAFHAPNRGSAHSASPIVGTAPDKSGSGYYLVSSSGRVFAFHAKFLGSATKPGSKVAGIALDQQTGGYWIVTVKGKVFAFDAGKYKGKKLSGVTGIAADPKRQGYWLVTAHGKVYAFNVPGHGSMPFSKVGATIAIAADPASGGYWLATATGHVAAFSALWHGDQPGTTSRVTGIASAP